MWVCISVCIGKCVCVSHIDRKTCHLSDLTMVTLAFFVYNDQYVGYVTKIGGEPRTVYDYRYYLMP